MADDFADLVRRAGEGDPAALDALVTRYEPKVRIVARVLLGPALRPYLDSADLAQSVHASILSGLRGKRFAVTEPDQLVRLAVTVLRRKAARHWRKVQRQARLSGDRTDRADSEQPDLLAGLTAADLDPPAAAAYREQLARLCDHLDDTERGVLNDRLDGYTPAEIADRVGVSAVALRVRLTRLRQRLTAAGVVADWL